jgi:hypothetical protein
MDVPWVDILRMLANEMAVSYENLIVRKCELYRDNPYEDDDDDDDYGFGYPVGYSTKAEGMCISKRKVARRGYGGHRFVPDERQPVISIGFWNKAFKVKIERNHISHDREKYKTTLENREFPPTDEGIKEMKEFVNWWSKELNGK